MRKHIFTSLLLILFYLSVNAQTNGVCVYKFQLIEKEFSPKKEDSEIIKNARKSILKQIDYVKNINYILKFNSSEAIAQVEESLSVDKSSDAFLHKIALALIGPGVYYQNKASGYALHQVDFMGESFLIKDDKRNPWIITKETKKIGKYLAYKAVKDCEECDPNEEVWFTPSINVPFGPLNYGGLPGLVLEIQKKKSILRLEKITFQKNKTIIEKPKKGRKVTAEEFITIAERARAEARN